MRAEKPYIRTEIAQSDGIIQLGRRLTLNIRDKKIHGERDIIIESMTAAKSNLNAYGSVVREKTDSDVNEACSLRMNGMLPNIKPTGNAKVV